MAENSNEITPQIELSHTESRITRFKDCLINAVTTDIVAKLGGLAMVGGTFGMMSGLAYETAQHSSVSDQLGIARDASPNDLPKYTPFTSIELKSSDNVVQSVQQQLRVNFPKVDLSAFQPFALGTRLVPGHFGVLVKCKPAQSACTEALSSLSAAEEKK